MTWNKTIIRSKNFKLVVINWTVLFMTVNSKYCSTWNTKLWLTSILSIYWNKSIFDLYCRWYLENAVYRKDRKSEVWKCIGQKKKDKGPQCITQKSKDWATPFWFKQFWVNWNKISQICFYSNKLTVLSVYCILEIPTTIPFSLPDVPSLKYGKR
jgi:hypothetical protein